MFLPIHQLFFIFFMDWSLETAVDLYQPGLMLVSTYAERGMELEGFWS